MIRKLSPAKNSRIRRRLIGISIILLCAGVLIYGACSVLLTVKQNVGNAQCAGNLKDIAGALINYSNAHAGQYPDTMEDVLRSSGMTSAAFVCPATADTPAEGTPAQQAAEIAAGRHISYVYLGKGLTSSEDATTVLVYDHPANHGGNGINVLFGDYHVGRIVKSDMKEFLASVDSGVRPVKWPPTK